MNPTTNPNKALWEKGDFTRIAATMRASGEALFGAMFAPKGYRAAKTLLPCAMRSVRRGPRGCPKGFEEIRPDSVVAA
jgi:hypothetical protein